MTSRIVLLEDTLRKLAHDLALQLVQAAFRLRVAELAEGLVAGSPAVRMTPLEARRASTSGARTSARPRRSAREAPAERRAVRASAFGGRERSAGHVHADDSDVPANIITDPGLLLDVIGSAARSSRRAPHREEPGEVDLQGPGLSAANGNGPVLRPGERVQRTAAGHVVLRRGGK